MSKTSNLDLNVYLLAIIGIGLLWRGGETLNKKISALPIKTMVQNDSDNTKPINFNSLHDVSVMQMKLDPTITKESLDVETLFRKENEPASLPAVTIPNLISTPAPIVIPKVDYALLIKRAIHLDGLSNDGVFIQGRFYQVGEKLKEFTLDTSSGPLIPQLIAVTEQQAQFRVGTQTLFLRYKQND